MRNKLLSRIQTGTLAVLLLGMTALPGIGPAERAYADSDTTAPAAVTSLAADNDDNDADPAVCDFWHCSSTSLKLAWTAPGDDGSAGTAASYDIRYSTAAITAGNWAAATPVATEPVPTAAGTAQTKIVRGLTPDTTYYFALKTKDEAGNESGLSNVSSKKTDQAWGMTLDNSKLVSEAGGGDVTKLIDGNTATDWSPTSYPASMNINYGYTWGSIVSINQIKVYTSGGTGTLSVYVGRPGKWSLLYSDTLSGTAGWLTHTVNTIGEDFRFTLASPAGTAKISEIQLVGSGAAADTTAPRAVTNLSASGATNGSLTLGWTAPGDDDEPSGYADSYDIRYGTSPITAANWAAATQVTGEPTPAEAGTSQTMTVSGLASGTTYYFAMKASDLNYTSPTATYANTSLLSNIASGLTTGVLDTTAPAAVSNLAASNPTVSSVKLAWTAPGDDGGTGTAASYDIRYSTSAITSGNWASASQAAGEPAPAAAGTSQNFTVTGLSAGTTYYFAMKTSDEVPNVSAISNVVSKATNAVPPRIAVPADLVVNEIAKGNALNLFDEQGDPAAGSGGAPATLFTPGSKTWFYPANVDIDLGVNYTIASVYIYDKLGHRKFKVRTGSPAGWTTYATPGGTTAGWLEIPVNASSRYVQITLDDNTATIGEAVLYGTASGTYTPPTASPHTNPKMEEFIGLNGFIDDPVANLQVGGFVREYHNWGWDEGDYSPTYAYPYPNNRNKWNPSYGAGGAWNFDGYYSTLNSAGVTVSPSILGTVPWLNAGGKPVPTGADPLLPASYAAYADHLFQYAARFGGTAVADGKLKLAPDQARSTGLGTLRWIEDDNEQDADWATRDSYSTPFEYAAQASADYDGHLGAMGNTFGVKNADPNMKMAMGGLADPNLDYIKSMKWWSTWNRGGSVPFDAMNVHNYANATPSGWTVGASPESFDLYGKMKVFTDYRDKYMPGKEVWLSEFGYDTSPTSPQRAPAIGTFSQMEVQGQWLVRSYLVLAAAGVDKAMMFMSRDTNATSSTQFDSSGLWTSSGTPKISYYYVYTLKNTLSGMRFLGEQASGNPNVKIYKFKSATGSGGAYAVWAPTSNQTTVSGYQLSLAGTPTTANLVQMQSGSTTGVSSALTISSGKATVNVGERPVFVTVNNIS